MNQMYDLHHNEILVNIYNKWLLVVYIKDVYITYSINILDVWNNKFKES